MIISFTSLVCESNLRQAVVMGFKSLSLKLLDIFRNSLGGAEAAALFSHKNVICRLLRLNLREKRALSIFKMYMSRPTKKYKWLGEIKPKGKTLRHFKVVAVETFDE